MVFQDFAFKFKALSDSTRVEIVEMLKGGSLCACKILEKFEISQPTLSYHMKILVDSGIVGVEKLGIWNHYTLKTESMQPLTQFLSESKSNRKV